MDRDVNLLLKMIEQHGESLAKKAEICKETRPDLVSEVEEFYSLYRSLAEQYDYLNAELYNSMPSEYQLQDAGSAPETPTLTPEQKLGSTAKNRVASVSSGAASSEISLKDGSDSSSSSSDSESESLNSSGNAYYSLPMNSISKSLHPKVIEFGTTKIDVEENGDAENGNYEEMLSKLVRYEEELKVSNLKLQLSEQEVTRLKDEIAKSERYRELAETLQVQLESALRDVEMREANLEEERKGVMELQKKTADDLQELQGELKMVQGENFILKASLDSETQQVLELQEMILKCKNDQSDCGDEVKELRLALLNAEETFSVEKTELLYDLYRLSEEGNLIKARLRERELLSESIEEKLRKCQSEKMELLSLHRKEMIGLQSEISELKLEVSDRGGQVEVLNKNLDSLKFKYDMLMAEKDGMNAKLQTILAELSSRDDQIVQMEENLLRMRMENAELIDGSETVQKQVNELRSRVAELEKEVERQRCEISAGGEEKREAIRQLCMSLDHYMSGYKELFQAIVKHKRQALMAS